MRFDFLTCSHRLSEGRLSGHSRRPKYRDVSDGVRHRAWYVTRPVNGSGEMVRWFKSERHGAFFFYQAHIWSARTGTPPPRLGNGSTSAFETPPSQRSTNQRSRAAHVFIVHFVALCNFCVLACCACRFMVGLFDSFVTVTF